MRYPKTSCLMVIFRLEEDHSTLGWQNLRFEMSCTIYIFVFAHGKFAKFKFHL